MTPTLLRTFSLRTVLFGTALAAALLGLVAADFRQSRLLERAIEMAEADAHHRPVTVKRVSRRRVHLSAANISVQTAHAFVDAKWLKAFGVDVADSPPEVKQILLSGFETNAKPNHTWWEFIRPGYSYGSADFPRGRP